MTRRQRAGRRQHRRRRTSGMRWASASHTSPFELVGRLASTCPLARSSPCSARAERASRRCSRCSACCAPPTQGEVLYDGRRADPPVRARTACSRRRCSSVRGCSRARFAATSPTGSPCVACPDRSATASSPRNSRASGSPDARRTAPCGCRVGRRSASRSLGRSRCGRASCSSTSPSRRSTHSSSASSPTSSCRSCARPGVTVVWVTHDQDEAQLVADRIAVMDKRTPRGVRPRRGSPRASRTIRGSRRSSACLVHSRASCAAQRRASSPSTPRTGRASAHRCGPRAMRMSARSCASRCGPRTCSCSRTAAELPLTTARNQLNAEVTSIEPRGGTFSVELDAGGMPLAASVSRASVRELALAPGTRVLAVFKATAVRWAEALTAEAAGGSAGTASAGSDKDAEGRPA